MGPERENYLDGAALVIALPVKSAEEGASLHKQDTARALFSARRTPSP